MRRRDVRIKIYDQILYFDLITGKLRPQHLAGALLQIRMHVELGNLPVRPKRVIKGNNGAFYGKG